MISGEKGQAIMAGISVLRLEALVDGDQITTALISACIADALRKGETPRAITLALWDGLPNDESWNGGVREYVEGAIEEYERTSE